MALLSTRKFAKKYLNDQNNQYGSNIPRVKTDRIRRASDTAKYSPNEPTKVIFFLM